MIVKSNSDNYKLRVLAVASGGGHLQQLMQIAEAFRRHDLLIATTDAEQASIKGFNVVAEVSDYNQNKPIMVLKGLFEALRIVKAMRPDVVVSTGAAPGLLGLLGGRLLGAKTIWIDSIANSERLSLSGRMAQKFSHITLTQWEHIAEQDKGLQYWGSVI